MAILHRVVRAITNEKIADMAAFECTVSRVIRRAVKDRAVLETGCGPGFETNRFLREFGAKRAIAMDVSLGMLTAEREKNPALLLVQADARHLPFASGAVDVIYSNSMYHHIEVPDRKLVLTESLRVARECVFLSEIAGFSNPIVNRLYRSYYSIVDGSAYRPTVDQWLEFLFPHVTWHLRRPEKAVVLRFVFFVLRGSSGPTVP